MAEIMKGVVVSFAGDLPVVRPYGSESAVSPPLDNQWRPCGDNVQCKCYCTDPECTPYQGCPLPALVVGDVVAFAVFDDGTGVVLAKMGG